ncbi:MAG: UDP-glucose/GDP-mannose dehydrogenase family protein [Candidatus Aminicenantes bacterium]|nr:UDP-glucose/GDP-mannose dehydrogenase family protein [Candidatus Aminicenantes bacterium]
MKIGVIGTGYVGLVTAAGLAEFGHRVIGTDKDAEKIAKCARGVAPIYEPGLEALLRRHLDGGRLTFTADVAGAIRDSDVVFVCVGTPQDEGGRADMSQIEEVARTIAGNLTGYKLVVEKSTVPVRTSAWIKRVITLHSKSEQEFDIASNPEFLREGVALNDFLEPDRIVIGVETAKARDIMCRIYERYAERLLITNIDTAELIKHASNSFLALKISYINMIADLCERTDADVEQVALGMGLDPRIGREFLRAGIGYGGSCFPKDVKALVKIGEDLGVPMNLLRETERINLERMPAFIEKIKRALWILKDKTIGVLGLAFKPQTDDIREASSIRLIQDLRREGAVLRLYDPQAMDNMKVLFPADDRLVYCADLYAVADGANALLLVTEWEEFKSLDFGRLRRRMANPILIDGRNLFDPADVRRLGFEYFSVGRK